MCVLCVLGVCVWLPQVGAGATVGVQIGNMYTASLYGSLCGLISRVSDADLVRILDQENIVHKLD